MNDIFKILAEPAPVIDNDGTKRWYSDGKLHRDNDRPAVEWADGSMYWYKDGAMYKVVQI